MSKANTRSRSWTARSHKAPNEIHSHELAFLGTRPRWPHTFADRTDICRCVFRRARILLPALVEAERVQGNWLLASHCWGVRFLRSSVFGVGVKQRGNRWDWCGFTTSLFCLARLHFDCRPGRVALSRRTQSLATRVHAVSRDHADLLLVNGCSRVFRWRNVAGPLR